jgi:hypothetical protein
MVDGGNTSSDPPIWYTTDFTVSAVPEPTTAAMLGTGLLALVGARTLRRRGPAKHATDE